jgi:hypothetical protein
MERVDRFAVAVEEKSAAWTHPRRDNSASKLTRRYPLNRISARKAAP